MVGCAPTVEKKPLVDMDCLELISELQNPPHPLITQNEIYRSNVLDIMQLKQCELK